MKNISSELAALLNAARTGDVALTTANCFKFTLSTNIVVALNDVDVPIVYNGVTYLPGTTAGITVKGLKYKASVGLDVDKQTVSFTAEPTAFVNGATFMGALRDGAFDGASVQRFRVFRDPSLPGGIDGVLLFQGRVSTIDKAGRSQAQMTVASDLIVLDYDMPKNIFSPTCVHVTYDSGCGLSAAAWASYGVAGLGSTDVLINFAGALAQHQQGKLVFATGVNANAQGTVNSVVPGTSVTMIYPFPDPPAVGDAFTVYAGDDHTPATCKGRFNNFANFRGYPFVPPPQIGIALACIGVMLAARIAAWLFGPGMSI